MTAVRFLQATHTAARVASALAAAVMVIGVGVHVFYQPEYFEHGVVVDTRVELPSDWATYPILAKEGETALPEIDSSSSIATGSRTLQGRIGDIFVRYEWSFCTLGGSSCNCQPQTLSDLWVGDLDADGRPALSTDTECTTTTTCFERPPEVRRCLPSSLTLRRSPDGAISVVTFVDPEPTERPVAAFTRRGVPRVLAPLRRKNKWTSALALMLWAGGVFAMLASRRHTRRLLWKEGELARGVVTCGELVAVVPGLEQQTGSLLVDPAVIASAHAYRDLSSVPRSGVFWGTRMEALARARRSAVAAAILSIVSLGAAVLCAVRVLF